MRRRINDAGYSTDVWDIDERGVPHDLGVLGHYDAVVWYLGDNRLTQDPEDETISHAVRGAARHRGGREGAVHDDGRPRLPQRAAASSSTPARPRSTPVCPASATPSVACSTGSTATREAECVVDTVPGFFEDCLIMADDFRQYYLGGFSRTDNADPESVTGIADPIDGFEGTFGGPVVEGDNPLNEAGVFQPTSEVLPVGEFPQFASKGAAEYTTSGENPYAPVEGSRYAGAVHQDSSYMRLSKTIDLTGASAGELAFQLSTSTEGGYDHVIVEAHTVGQDNWTTLPESGGKTTTDPPAECEPDGFLLQLHPFLEHYLGGAGCAGPGTTGEWNSFTGSTGGWEDVAFDLNPLRRQAGGGVDHLHDRPGHGWHRRVR